MQKREMLGFLFILHFCQREGHWLLTSWWQTEEHATPNVCGVYNNILPRLIRPPCEKRVSRFFHKFSQQETMMHIPLKTKNISIHNVVKVLLNKN